MLDAEFVTWLAWGLLLVAVLGAVMPFVRCGAWPVRVWDFPRMHMLILALLAAGLGAWLAAGAGWPWDLTLIPVLGLGAALVQATFVIPYTPLWPARVPVAESQLSILVMNVEYSNRRYDEVCHLIEVTDADVVLLIEIDEDWREACEASSRGYAHRVEEIRDEGLGMALWSRLPMQHATREHLVSGRRVSIWVDLSLEGRTVRVVGVHPTPPGLAVREGSGRYDSRIRDAELVRVARRIKEQAKASAPDGRSARPADGCSWLVAGDFNDVAWSHTTRLFERISGLLDPRVGRGLYATYPADRPFLRFPLDHLFLSDDLGIASLRRIRTPGSDHMALNVHLGRLDPERRPQPAGDGDDGEDQAEAGDMADEGHQDAAERAEHAARD